MGICSEMGCRAELLFELRGHALGVGAGAVELVDEGQARHLVAAHLAVDGVRLRLHAGDAAQHQHGAVEHAQGALDLDGEVHVPGRVDEVDGVTIPLRAGGGRLDGDALLALEIHESMVAPTPDLPLTSSILWIFPV